MAHWDEERDRQRVEMMRKCGQTAIDHKDLIDKFEETGDPIWREAFAKEILKAQRPRSADRGPEKA